jgi:hypothetical protein
MMKRLVACVAAGSVMLSCLSGRAEAGPVVIPDAPVTINLSDDPIGGSFSGTVTPSAGGTLFDNGLLTLSESITTVSPTSAWAVFHVSATGGQPLVGNSSGGFNIVISGIQTAPAAFIAAFTGFDVNGVDDPFPFPGTTLGPNPITGTGSVANQVFSPPYTITTSQQFGTNIDPYNQGPANFGDSPSNTPTGYTAGALYAVESVVPEPGSLTLAGLAAAGFAVRTWRRRSAR